MKEKTSDNPDAFLGYAKQLYRGLLYLVKKTAIVSIENNDDICVYDGYGYLVLEQVKDKNKRKVTVISDDFLDTILNWVKLYQQDKNKFNNRTKCVLALLLKNDVDDIIQSATVAKALNDCEDVYNKILARIKQQKKNSAYVSDFEKYKNDIIAILQYFEVSRPENSAELDCIDVIKNFLKGKMDASHIENCAQQLLGWFLEKTVNKETKETKNIEVTYNDFLAAFSKLNGNNIVVNYPQKEQISSNINDDSKMFIRQLKLLELNPVMIDEAKCDYWSWQYLQNYDLKDGRITTKEIDKMYGNLCSRWRMNKENIEIDNINDEVQFGKKLYFTSLKEKVQISGVTIQGDDVCISRGVHNYLADDIKKYDIGWHPKFKELLDENSK